MWNTLPGLIEQGDRKALSRAISLVENEAEGYEQLLKDLNPYHAVKLTGITGPAGSGKSTIVDGLIGYYIGKRLKVAVVCIDPTSPFTGGAILGDRVRMREWYNHPNVFIRSMATRGTWGGLNAGIIEITDIIKCAGFDQIIIETVGVGQTEIEIAAIADTTIVTQVPEGGDDIQAMKAGLMEVADIFAVNKCDRPGADEFIKNLKGNIREHNTSIPIIKLTASLKQGISDLASAIEEHHSSLDTNDKSQLSLIVKKAYQLLLRKKMKLLNQLELEKEIEKNYREYDFNLYKLLEKY